MIHLTSLVDSPILLWLLVVVLAAAIVYAARILLWVAGLASFAYNAPTALSVLRRVAPKVVQTISEERSLVDPERLAKTDGLLRIGFLLAAVGLTALAAISAIIVLLL